MKDEKKLTVRAMEDDHGDVFIEITISEKLPWVEKIRLTDAESRDLVTEIDKLLKAGIKDEYM